MHLVRHLVFENVMLDLIESVCDSSCLFISISGTWGNYEKKGDNSIPTQSSALDKIIHVTARIYMQCQEPEYFQLL